MVTVVDRLLLKINVDAKAFNNSVKNINKGLLGAGLSFLFTGMAIKRLFQTTLNSMLTTFLAVEGETGAVNNAVGNLLAAIEFLKFSLVDAAVAAGIFDIWIDRISSLVDIFLSLDESTKASIVDFIVLGTIGATALMVFGQTLLGILGILTAFGPLLSGILGLFKTIGSVIVGVFSMGFARFLLLLGPLGLFLFIMKKLIERAGGVGNAFKAMGAVVKIIFAGILDAIMAVIRTVALAIDLLIKGFNSVSRLVDGPIIPTIADRLPEYGAFTQAALESARLTRREIEFDVERQNVQRNQVVVQGDVLNDSLIDKIIAALEQGSAFTQGSPQQ